MSGGRSTEPMAEAADDRGRGDRAQPDRNADQRDADQRDADQRGAGDRSRTPAGRGRGGGGRSTPVRGKGGGGRPAPARTTGSSGRSTPARTTGSSGRTTPARTTGSSGRNTPARTTGSGGRTTPGRSKGRGQSDTGHDGGARPRAGRNGSRDRRTSARRAGSAPRPSADSRDRTERRDRTDRSRSDARPPGDRAGRRAPADRSNRRQTQGRSGAPAAAGRTGGPQSRERSSERADRPLGPPVDEDITGHELDAQVRRELDSLTKGHAEFVARHLVMAARAFDDDPELAYQHAAAARRRAGRVGLAREALALAAYRTGRYAEALTEFRAFRRITGSVDHWPTMADCERGLGRPHKALEMAGSSEVRKLDADGRIEMRIVAAGARRDLGQLDAALLTLRVPELSRGSGQAAARLRYAYADTLLAAGREDEALEWFHRAAAADADGATDAIERITDLEGVTFSEVDGLVDAEADVPVDGRTKISAD